MKFDLRKYNLKRIDTRELGDGKIEIRPELEKLVTFQLNVKVPRYGWFYYKQGFAYRLVEYYLDEFKLDSENTVLDPFCGVGTSSLVAKNRAMNSYGLDILPVNVLWSRVKLRDYNYSKKTLVRLLEEIIEIATKLEEPQQTLPDVYIVKNGLDKEVQDILLRLKETITTIDDKVLRDFFLAALASIVDKVSKTRKDGGFLRIVKDKKPPDVHAEFKDKSLAMISDLSIENDTRRSGIPRISEQDPDIQSNHIIKLGDARNLKEIASGTITAVITSPPYLNKTDYTRLYSLELYLIFIKEFIELRNIRYNSFRSHVEAKEWKDVKKVHKYLPETIFERIEEMKKKRLPNKNDPYMVLGYFEDMALSLLEMKRVLETGGRAAIVLWNARLSGVEFPVDVIVANMSEEMGFEEARVHVARLKGMSAQQVKKYGETPLRESVIVLKK